MDGVATGGGDNDTTLQPRPLELRAVRGSSGGDESIKKSHYSLSDGPTTTVAPLSPPDSAAPSPRVLNGICMPTVHLPPALVTAAVSRLHNSDSSDGGCASSRESGYSPPADNAHKANEVPAWDRADASDSPSESNSSTEWTHSASGPSFFSSEEESGARLAAEAVVKPSNRKTFKSASKENGVGGVRVSPALPLAAAAATSM